MAAMTTTDEEQVSMSELTRQALLELEGTVSHNRAKGYIARSQVAENNTTSAQNYNAAFLVNRRIANENTDALFRVRYGVLQRLPAVDRLTTEYKEAMLNRSKIQFLTFRSKVNDHAASISQELAELNALAIAINRRILEANEEIRQFNATIIEDNSTLYDQCMREPPTAEQNAAIVSGNLAMLRDLVAHASSNANAIDQLLVMTENNNLAASENTAAIAQNRHDMLEFNRIIFESRPNQSNQSGRDNSAVNMLMQASIGNFFPA